MTRPNHPRYWIGVASANHVALGLAGGFCQLCHGKAAPLKRMKAGDWIIYYSPKMVFSENTPCQAFTAIGRVIDDKVYAFEMAPDFVPYRRDISFFEAQSVSIRPLIPKLNFIEDKKHWAYQFRFGQLEIGYEDFFLIASAMIHNFSNILSAHTQDIYAH